MAKNCKQIYTIVERHPRMTKFERHSSEYGPVIYLQPESRISIIHNILKLKTRAKKIINQKRMNATILSNDDNHAKILEFILFL